MAANVSMHDRSRLEDLVLRLELHWSTPCASCLHNGRARAHPARVDAMEQLIVEGWLDPAQAWPFPTPVWLRRLVTDPGEGGIR